MTAHPAAYLRRSYVDDNSPGDISREAQRATVRTLAAADGHNGTLVEYDDWGVSADVWSVTSWNELRRDAVACEQDALLDPGAKRTPFVTRQLEGAPGPVVAVSDWMRAVPDAISRWVPQDWSSLGTDGYGRSDTRAALRRHFRIDPESIAVGVLNALAARGEVADDVPGRAVEQYGLRSEQVSPQKDNQAGSSEVSG